MCFLRQLIDLSTTDDRLNLTIVSDKDENQDVAWWKKFVDRWNGQEVFHTLLLLSSTLGLHTDACMVGMGGVYKSHCFSCPWPPHMKDRHINVLECFAVAAAI